MATTSFLYHTFGLTDYDHLCTEYKKGGNHFHIALKESRRRCAHCGSRRVVRNGCFERTFREIPMGLRPTCLVLHGHRQLCRDCGANQHEPIHFADPNARHTRRMARFIVTLAGFVALLHVALLLRVGWDLVKAAFSRHLDRKLKKRKPGKVRYIAIDEFASRKGHKYITIVLDLETGVVLYAAQGKGADAVLPFLWKLRRANAPLAAVAMDMSAAYQSAVRTVFPTVDIVFDPFHVMAMANRALDETRRETYSQLEGEDRNVIKGSRFLLLRGLESLRASQMGKLALLMDVNQPLYTAYLLKEDLRQFWNFPDRLSAMEFLADWLERAVESGLRHFIKVALSLIRHLQGLLSYFGHRISSGPIEGLNNKIKTLKRQAYGFRDMRFFLLRILFIHESIYTITG
jgi:transposase